MATTSTPRPIFWLAVVAILSLMATLFCFVKVSRQPTIVSVRMIDLTEKYTGVKKMRESLTSKKEKWKGEMDTLKSDYQKTAGIISDPHALLTPKQRQEYKDQLLAQQNNIEKYSRTVSEKAHTEQQELISQVSKAITKGTKEFAEENGYDIVMGTAPDNVVLYADSSLDVTDRLIAYLNSHYSAKD